MGNVSSSGDSQSANNKIDTLPIKENRQIYFCEKKGASLGQKLNTHISSIIYILNKITQILLVKSLQTHHVDSTWYVCRDISILRLLNQITQLPLTQSIKLLRCSIMYIKTVYSAKLLNYRLHLFIIKLRCYSIY